MDFFHWVKRHTSGNCFQYKIIQTLFHRTTSRPHNPEFPGVDRGSIEELEVVHPLSVHSTNNSSNIPSHT